MRIRKIELKRTWLIKFNNYIMPAKGKQQEQKVDLGTFKQDAQLSKRVSQLTPIEAKLNKQWVDDKIYEVNLLYQDQYTQTITKDIEIKNYTALKKDYEKLEKKYNDLANTPEGKKK